MVRKTTLHDPMILTRPVHSILGRGSHGSKLQILIYHRVLEDRDELQPTEPTVDEFREQMQLVSRHFNVLPLSDALNRLASGTLPARPLSITFDDGYADNYRVALPVLQSLGLPATVFVATDYLDGGIMFNDVVRVSVMQHSGDCLDLSSLGMQDVLSMENLEQRRRSFNTLLAKLKYMDQRERQEKSLAIAELVKAELPTDLMMTSRQLLEASEGGLEIGAHTLSHPILKNISPDSARREIAGSRIELQERINASVDVFAYPNGKPDIDFSSRDAILVREAGFKGAVTTRAGCSHRATDPYQLRRFTPWTKQRWRFMAQLLKNYTES